VQSTRSWVGRKGLYELALVSAGLLIYFLIRGAVADEAREATAHALAIVHFERWAGFFWEPRLQHLLGAHLAQIQFWDVIYFWGHAPVIIAVALWLYRYHRSRYALIRNAFLVSAVIGLLVYWVYPVAPPRLLGGYGFVDTMQRYSSLSYQAESLKPFVNPYAAVPSLHFGWSLLIGIGLVLTLRSPLGWLLGAVLPVLMLVAVIVTANHFIFDILAGLGVCLIGLLAAVAVQRWQHARVRPLPTARLPGEIAEPARVYVGK
jgi:hypothetical protein